MSDQPPNPSTCEARGVLELVGDKWSLYVVSFLGDGPRRFTELKRGVEGISQRMLTVTLRGLERDGILTRTVQEVMPPNVSYQLTAMGRSLLQFSGLLVQWSEQHLGVRSHDVAGEPEVQGRCCAVDGCLGRRARVPARCVEQDNFLAMRRHQFPRLGSSIGVVYLNKM